MFQFISHWFDNIRTVIVGALSSRQPHGKGASVSGGRTEDPESHPCGAANSPFS